MRMWCRRAAPSGRRPGPGWRWSARTPASGLRREGEGEGWDFGTGAGFYVDATQAPWAANYKMYSYVTQELVELVAQSFPRTSRERRGVFGHSMGGHGALTIAFKNPGACTRACPRSPHLPPLQLPLGPQGLRGLPGPRRRGVEES
ncbi:unnamed protein product [Heterosigma akashiwo]